MAVEIDVENGGVEIAMRRKLARLGEGADRRAHVVAEVAEHVLEQHADQISSSTTRRRGVAFKDSLIAVSHFTTFLPVPGSICTSAAHNRASLHESPPNVLDSC